jgi:signal transduction histidine kinase
MWSRFRPPMFAFAIVLLGLMALLGTLQYHWLGQVSQAERDRMRSTLSTGASEFAIDFDRELTRAYLLFQTEPGTGEETTKRFAERYQQWQATSRFPRLLKDFYLFSRDPRGEVLLRRFDVATQQLHLAEWPESMADWRQQFAVRDLAQGDPMHRTLFIARMSQPLWEKVPAIIAPMMPFLFLSERSANTQVTALFSYAILTLDADYVSDELLPSLAERHFKRADSRLDFKVAVIRTAPEGGVVYSSSPAFAPAPDADADATADLFQVRTQDFTSMAAEVHRFTTFAGAVHAPPGRGSQSSNVMTFREARPLSIVVQPGGTGADAAGSRRMSTTTKVTAITSPRWKLVLKHPAGSLEAAVGNLRRRNLIVSSSILGVLGASMGLLVLSTRRAQRLARQQMEFVAAVSHELRTPLAVIRSAADNLADGVVRDDEQVRKYGELMRSEGRRLTEMVEQILELAGIQSGQRGFGLRAVAIEPLLQDIISSSAELIQRSHLDLEMSIPEDLPPVLGDEPALRRVFQNLIGNAIKYGAGGGWIGVSAAKSGSDVRITVADRGMGIPLAEQIRIFEPFYRANDAIAAQIQGAGLGLSLVQRIVEAHGGRVSVKSAPGEGSEFTVQLPAAGEEPIPRPVGDAQPASS